MLLRDNTSGLQSTPHTQLIPHLSAVTTSLLLHASVDKYCNEYVCLSVCLSVCPVARSNLIIFLCMLPVAVAQSSSDGVAIRYVLPVVRMTSFCHAIKHDVMFMRSSARGSGPISWARATGPLARRAVLLPRRPRARDVGRTVTR